MTRRTVSLVTAGAVLFVLVLVSFYAPMPYVVMSPGLTENTLGSYNGTKVIQVVEDQPREKVSAALSGFLSGIRTALDSGNP